jgi:hypothetical protein
VINKNKIVTGPAYLTIEGIPTPLLIPFGFFPNKQGRSSGIIFPAFGESAQRGFYFQHLGYYFGFSDYITLAVTSDLYTKGSYTFDAVSDYKKRYKYNGNVTLSYAHTINSEKELPDYNVLNDYHITWRHNQDPKKNPNSTFNALVDAGTNSYYTNVISTTNNFLTNTLQSSVTYNRSIPNKPINFSLALRHNQNTLTKAISITAPDMTFSVSRINPFKRKYAIGRQRWYEKIGTNYTLRGTNRIETVDSLLFSSETLKNLKNGFTHSIPLNTSFNVFSYYNVTPGFNYTERFYFETLRYKWNNELKKVDTLKVKGFQSGRDYQASVGVNTRIYGMYQYSKGPVTALRHVISPTMAFSYRPDFNKDRFGYYKTVLLDSIGRTRRYSIFEQSVYGGPPSGPYANLSFSLDNNIEMKVKTNSDTGATDKKVKLLESLRLGAAYNMIADSMKLSLVSVSGRTTLLEKINLNFSGTLDPYSFDENNIDYDKFMVSEGGRLVRLTDADVTMSFALNKTDVKVSENYSSQELDYINSHPEEYVDFNVPYNLSVSYSYHYNKQGNAESIVTQSASFNGDVNVTPKWKVGFNSWYDITDGRFTNLNLNIYRDLHCWEMRLNWIPFGFQESWNFQINVKASILQDLKLLKRKDIYDR